MVGTWMIFHLSTSILLPVRSFSPTHLNRLKRDWTDPDQGFPRNLLFLSLFCPFVCVCVFFFVLLFLLRESCLVLFSYPGNRRPGSRGSTLTSSLAVPQFSSRWQSRQRHLGTSDPLIFCAPLLLCPIPVSNVQPGTLESQHPDPLFISLSSLFGGKPRCVL